MTSSSAVHPFRAAAQSDDIDALIAQLADDIVLNSPVTYQPYVGKETVGALLRLISETFDGWRCVQEISGPDDVIGFVFRTKIGDRELEGLDLLKLGPDGKVVELTVMIRPMSGVIALAQAIGPKVEAAGLKAGASPA